MLLGYLEDISTNFYYLLQYTRFTTSWFHNFLSVVIVVNSMHEVQKSYEGIFFADLKCHFLSSQYLELHALIT